MDVHTLKIAALEKWIAELEAKLEKFQEAEARLAEYEQAESAYNKKFVRRRPEPMYDSDDQPLIKSMKSMSIGRK